MNKKEWEIQQITARRTFQGKLYYQIRWKGFSENRSTWESEESLLKTIPLVEIKKLWKNFKARLKGKKSKNLSSKATVHIRAKKYFYLIYDPPTKFPGLRFDLQEMVDHIQKSLNGATLLELLSVSIPDGSRHLFLNFDKCWSPGTLSFLQWNGISPSMLPRVNSNRRIVKMIAKQNIGLLETYPEELKNSYQNIVIKMEDTELIQNLEGAEQVSEKPKKKRRKQLAPGCSICLNKFKQDSQMTEFRRVVALSCGHIFHEICLTKAESVKPKECPNCRQRFTNVIAIHFS